MTLALEATFLGCCRLDSLFQFGDREQRYVGLRVPRTSKRVLVEHGASAVSRDTTEFLFSG